MSETRAAVVLLRSSPAGVERPAPRWSTRTTRKREGSKKTVSDFWQPAPGPPWRKRTGGSEWWGH